MGQQLGMLDMHDSFTLQARSGASCVSGVQRGDSLPPQCGITAGIDFFIPTQASKKTQAWGCNSSSCGSSRVTRPPSIAASGGYNVAAHNLLVCARLTLDSHTVHTPQSVRSRFDACRLKSWAHWLLQLPRCTDTWAGTSCQQCHVARRQHHVAGPAAAQSMAESGV